mmetsp:Transcript_18880/g.61589  ORF Transcript_18880/g.61589 Transcript_18880/m.61589 type:complete len:119 (-) Transcript_18880:586-942(-)
MHRVEIIQSGKHCLRLRRVRTYVFALRQRWLYENQRALLQIHRLHEQRDSNQALLRWCSAKQSQLSTVNVLNDCFHIWHSGPFATINGFRLGRNHTTQVCANWEPDRFNCRTRWTGMK